MAGIQQGLIGSFASNVGDYESIATASGTGASGTISFTSIPSTYTHLQLRMFSRDDAAGTEGNYIVQFNNDTAANYNSHYLEGSGAAVAAGVNTTKTYIYAFPYPQNSVTASVYGGLILDILDYANTNKYKTSRALGGYDANGSGYVDFTSGLWMSTSAINRVDIKTMGAGNWTTASRFALYGIKG